MALTNLPVFQALKSKMQWHQTRQGVLAENIANADTPRYHAKDLKSYAFSDHIGRTEFGVQTTVTKKGHITGTLSARSGAKETEESMFEVTPSGNNVVLEEQMMKVTQNQMDFQAATSIYSKSLSLIRTALSKSA